MLTSTICAAVSAAGLGIAALTAYRKRFLAATRIAAFSLVPIGLVLTGIVDWLTDVVFKPSVWAGFGILALSALLFMVSRVAERRRLGGGRKERKAAEPGAQRDALAPGASAPSLGPGRGASRPQAKAKKSADGEDFSDIEAILKKHGI
ncbi:hypothetical protein B7P34_11300 [Streptosporangium nondiastaticum]|uniref:Cellulose synthase n=1 Tax=Streptosporangium nondiastaticum TaxID=35764 RepID=A0A9X7PHW5_9ACTN|nr:hypothetical protein [Streptosporangium nondiastaticum]PSJ28585.1 hypothetical protein B7P34_11300 [Streptosporangium nondiastaticum]